jgi:hypothetical protein
MKSQHYGAPVLHPCQPHGPELPKVCPAQTGNTREGKHLLVARRCTEEKSAALLRSPYWVGGCGRALLDETKFKSKEDVSKKR